MDQRHIGIAKVGGKWHALRPMQQSDFSMIHMDPKPKNLAIRIMTPEGVVAGEKLIAPLTDFDAQLLNLPKQEVERINREITMH
jgi:hypothetical protein